MNVEAQAPKNSLVLPEDIQPIFTKERLQQQTSSPYKNQSTESLRLAQKCERWRGHGVRRNHDGEGSGRNVVRRQREATSSSGSESDEDALNTDYGESFRSLLPENASAPCTFCNTIYCNDRPGEPWVQCQSCDLWAHVACGGSEGDYYICDFCR